MQIGIISDTHDERHRTAIAVERLQAEGAEVLFHCGDLVEANIVGDCALLPCYFVFGNNDVANVPEIQSAIAGFRGAVCLEWGGEVQLSGKRIAMTHGHRNAEIRRLLSASPDYLFSGHSHIAADWREGTTRRINPGALHRARRFSVALLNLENDELRFLEISR